MHSLKKNKTDFECDVNFYITAKSESFLSKYFGIQKIEKKKGKIHIDGKKIKIKAGLKTIFEAD